jgi:trk system potassium uptake protein
MKKTKETVLVIGASRLGASIASFCSKQGIYSIIVDKDKEAFKKLDPSFSGFFIEGNAESLTVLEKAHIKEAREVDVVTGDDDTNIFLACLVARYFSVPFINVRLVDSQKEKLLPNDRVKVISPSILSYNLYQSLRAGENSL